MLEHRIETHAHTGSVSPCGRLSPERLVAAYCAAGYHGLAVTDHLTATLPIFRGATSWRQRVDRFFSGYRAVCEAAAGTGLAVYPGFELTFSDRSGQDFLVFGIDERALLDLPDVYSLSRGEFRRRISEIGGLVVQAHPFRNGGSPDQSLVDGIEVFNGNPRHDSNNARAAEYARRHGLLSLSGSDAHQDEDVGAGGVILPEVPGDGAELVRWLRDRPEEVKLIVSHDSKRRGRATAGQRPPR